MKRAPELQVDCGEPAQAPAPNDHIDRCLFRPCAKHRAIEQDPDVTELSELWIIRKRLMKAGDKVQQQIDKLLRKLTLKNNE